MLIVLAFHSVSARGADYDLTFYDRWASLPGERLFKMARGFIAERNMPDSALVCYTVLANRYYERSLEGEELRRSMDAMINLGYLYCAVYFDYQKSYGYLQKALEIANEQGDTKVLPYIYLNMGVLYGAYEDLNGHNVYSKETVGYFKDALAAAVKHSDWRPAMFCFTNILDIKFDAGGDYLSDIKSFEKLPIPANAPLYKYTLFMCRGMKAFSRKDYGEALSCFRKMETAVDPAEKGSIDMLRFKAMHYQASVLFACGDNYDALRLLNSIADTAAYKNLKMAEIWVCRMLYRHFEAAGDSDKADAYQLRYFKAKDALAKSGHIEDVNQMRFLSQLKDINDRVKELSVKRRQQNVLMIVVMSTSVIIISILLLLIRNYRKQRIYITNLYEKNMALLARGDAGTAQNGVKKKYSCSVLDEQTKDALLEKIADVMGNVDVVCSVDFSIKQLCDMVGSNTTYVSQVINERYGMNFKALLNEKRVGEACRRLSDVEHFGNYTIEAVAQSVGFKSRTNFSIVFKRITGLSASEFQKAARSRQ